MNFIDAALADPDHLSDDGFLQAMADIYREPEVRDVLDAYPQYVRDVIHIIDYDTALQMEGLMGVLEGGTAERLAEIHTALVNAGALEEARVLQEARQLSIEDDLYYEQLAGLSERTALCSGYEAFWELVRAYIGRSRHRPRGGAGLP